ncbi:hypothetical protein [Kangiella shandongensis]|uniref:hypothetical protein n=1 Tax=Kangiella shandongensis TaxID=2763258 RepID=UPI001CBD70D5|nr:hypothetical protein [Kangiella shandongensis]
MIDVNKLLDEYEAHFKVLMTEKYGSDSFRKAEENIIKTLESVRGHITDEHLGRLTKILDEYGGQEILIELAYTLGALGTDKSFDYLLRMFHQSFEDGCEEYNTAMACLAEMDSLDKERTEKEGVYDHHMLLM